MRLLKQKGRKDLRYLICMNMIFSATTMNSLSYSLLLISGLPITREDLENRKELLEHFVYGSSHTFVLTEEIKKISKFYLKQKIEHNFITAYGQKVTFICEEGRLYLSCDNYSEVFGYHFNKQLLKIENLNCYQPREREIIFGLFQFYDKLIQMYIQENNIDIDKKTLKTEVFESILKTKKLSHNELELLKKSSVLRDVQFSKLNLDELVKNSSENKVDKPKTEEKRKFFI
jgi:hypothetical protein